MNNRYPIYILLIAAAIFSLLLSSCLPPNGPSSLPTVPPIVTMFPPQAPTATMPPSAPTGGLSLDLSVIVPGQTAETIAAVPASTEGAASEAAPQYRRVTLLDYPVSGNSWKPQIFIYPAGELASANETMGKAAADLKTLLQTRKPGEQMPFLPLAFSSRQVIDVQVKYLDFKSGNGVRFLTQFNNGIVPVNNKQLLYTFQGLTVDGKYYISAVLPVTHPELPATDQGFAHTEAELKEFPAYLKKTIAWMEQVPNASFTPDLAKLDALIQSIEVK
jgi:hypothetical protein